MPMQKAAMDKVDLLKRRKKRDPGPQVNRDREDENDSGRDEVETEPSFQALYPLIGQWTSGDFALLMKVCRPFRA
jgi:hypothetical protein